MIWAITIAIALVGFFWMKTRRARKADPTRTHEPASLHRDAA